MDKTVYYSTLYDYYGGAEINELAIKYELSESHIYKIIERRY